MNTTPQHPAPGSTPPAHSSPGTLSNRTAIIITVAGLAVLMGLSFAWSLLTGLTGLAILAGTSTVGLIAMTVRRVITAYTPGRSKDTPADTLGES